MHLGTHTANGGSSRLGKCWTAAVSVPASYLPEAGLRPLNPVFLKEPEEALPTPGRVLIYVEACGSRRYPDSVVRLEVPDAAGVGAVLLLPSKELKKVLYRHKAFTREQHQGEGEVCACLRIAAGLATLRTQPLRAAAVLADAECPPALAEAVLAFCAGAPVALAVAAHASASALAEEPGHPQHTGLEGKWADLQQALALVAAA